MYTRESEMSLKQVRTDGFPLLHISKVVEMEEMLYLLQTMEISFCDWSLLPKLKLNQIELKFMGTFENHIWMPLFFSAV